MKRPLKLLRALLLTSSAVLSLSGEAAETMNWAIQDFAPLYIPVDGKPGQGVNDGILKSIVAAWPGTEHRYTVAAAARIYALLDAGEPLCFVGGLRTPEREARYYLTDVQLAPPLQLIAHRRVLKPLPLDANGELRLPELLANPALRGVLVAKRSYGSAIDQALAQRPAAAPVEVLASTSMGGNFFDMLRLDRADYTIDYDFMLVYRQNLAGHKFEELVSLPIKGNGEPAVVVAVCPRTPWGKEAIKRIDRIVATLAATAGLGLPDPRWTTPEAERRYGAAMREFNQKRRAPTPGLGSP